MIAGLPFVPQTAATSRVLHDRAGPGALLAWLLATIIKMLVLFTIYLVGVALLTLARAQDRGLDSGSSRAESRRSGRICCSRPPMVSRTS